MSAAGPLMSCQMLGPQGSHRSLIQGGGTLWMATTVVKFTERPRAALRTAGCARRRGRHQAGGHMHMPLPGHSRMMLKAQFSKPAFNYHKSSPIHYEQRREKLLHSAWLSIYCTQFLLQLLLADKPKWHSLPNFQRPAHG